MRVIALITLKRETPESTSFASVAFAQANLSPTRALGKMPSLALRDQLSGPERQADTLVEQVAEAAQT